MLRFFVETLPLAHLCDPPLLAKVAACADGLVLAVRPGETALGPAAAAVRAAGLDVALWPMLEDDAGRWCTLENAEPFVAFARRCVHDAPTASALLFDLEPPWRVLDALSHGRFGEGARALWQSTRSPGAEAAITGLATELEAQGLSVQTAEFPWALGAPRLGRFFGVPHLGREASRGLMLYTSMFEGYARGLCDRRRASLLLERLGALALRRLGPSTELQLGAVGAGALANEPTYRDVGELESDLDTCIRLGARRVAVFELGGILRRPDAERWLGACAVARDLLGERSSR